MKFVSAKKPVDHALQLQESMKKAAKLRSQLRELESEQELLAAYLRRSYPEGFRFEDVRGRDMMMRVTYHDRQILNQKKAIALLNRLGKAAPYNKVTVHQVSVVPFEGDE
jgi:hypothetical protein